jgi:GNAT superfamily N-acetyltransferase
MTACNIRTMSRKEVDLAIALAATEGWNPGLHDAAAFHAADPDGFLMAEVDGELAGCISAVSYAGEFGFIGLYIVLPRWRGQGIGMQLWTAAMHQLSGQLIGLDGVIAQQDNYRNAGFVLAWNNARYAGRRGLSAASAGADIVPLSRIPFDQLCADDHRVFPAPRPAFLRAWLATPDAHALGLKRDGKFVAWGCIRACRDGYKIAPLVADDAAAASELFHALCVRVPVGAALYLDVPLPNKAAVALAESAGMRVVFETARMYHGEAPTCELERVFGITSFELG